MHFAPYARAALSRYVRTKCLFTQRWRKTFRSCTGPLFLVIAKSYCDGSFHEPLSIISYRLAHLWSHLQPCMVPLLPLSSLDLLIHFFDSLFRSISLLFEFSPLRDLGQKNIIFSSFLKARQYHFSSDTKCFNSFNKFLYLFV